MELCPNCKVRFKRDIFKECPGCGFIDVQHKINHMVGKMLDEVIAKGNVLYKPIDIWKDLGGH